MTDDWRIYRGTGEPHDAVFPEPPPWRHFSGGPTLDSPLASDDLRLGRQGSLYQPDAVTVDVVNAALCLRRPLLVTGPPGTGKSSLAYSIAHELRLGRVLRWSITSRSILADGLYQYDAIGRLQESNLAHVEPAPGIGRYIQLGPLGTALLPQTRPRVLLIDELDKSDIDLPNDLLNAFEEGQFAIPELSRMASEHPDVAVAVTGDSRLVPVSQGVVCCREFPVVVLTSNGERDFPPAFLRRCVRLDLARPDEERLARIVAAHLGDEAREQARELIERYLRRQDAGDELATDQLMNAVYLLGLDGRHQTGARDVTDLAILRALNERL